MELTEQQQQILEDFDALDEERQRLLAEVAEALLLAQRASA